MDAIIVYGGLNQHDDDDMLTKEISVSSTSCVCLKKTCDAHVCTKCRKTIRTFCGHSSKDDEMNTLCTFFLQNCKFYRR